jgi:uncharacterized tellurite resistance protein B-like protein
MLEQLKRLFRAIASEPAARPRLVFDDADHRVAAAGLLVHAMNVDGVKSATELKRLEALLSERFHLDAAEVAALIAAADQLDREAVDLSAFTGIVKRAYTDEGRQRIVEMMWEIVFADGALHEFEDNMVWRVAELLDVAEADRGAIRRRVAAATGVVLADAGE